MSSGAQTELKARLCAAKKGDQRAFEELLEAYEPLIGSLTCAFSASNAEERDDLRQEACIAFYHAMDTYDTEQEDVQFGLYAKTCIRNRLVSYTRGLHRMEPIPLDDTDLQDRADPEQTLVEEEAYRALYHKIEALLSPYENRVWWLYLSGRTAREIAALFSRDERSVQNAIYRIRKKLRSSLPNP